MTASLDFAFFGSSLVSAYWNGAATYYRGIIRALHAHGHRITFYEPDAFDRQQHRDIDTPPWANVIVYNADGERAAHRVVDDARRADVVIKASGVGVFDALLERAVLEARRHDSIVAFWDVDAPATLDRVEHNPEDPFRELIPRYDVIFTYGGGDSVVRAYRALGARECIPIYNALDPTTHYPVAPDTRFACDLGFLGNRLPDRETRVDEFFIKAAERLPERSFLLGGNGWEKKHLPPNVRTLGHVYTHEHNAFNCAANVVLNVNRESMARYGFSPPTRVFEAAGAGACLITDEWPGIEMFLEPGREVLVAHTGDAVAESIASLTPTRRQAIGLAAFRRVTQQHTYAQRAVEVLSTIDALQSSTKHVRTRSISPTEVIA